MTWTDPFAPDRRIRLSTLERALQIAAEVHSGQVDDTGEPRILHPLRVMQTMDDPEARIVAILQVRALALLDGARLGG